MKRNVIIILIVVVVVLGIGGYFGYQQMTASLRPPHRVCKRQPVQRGSIVATVAAAGNLSAVQNGKPGIRAKRKGLPSQRPSGRHGQGRPSPDAA